jgi:hypothetical protein
MLHDFGFVSGFDIGICAISRRNRDRQKNRNRDSRNRDRQKNGFYLPCIWRKKEKTGIGKKWKKRSFPPIPIPLLPLYRNILPPVA